MHITIRTALGLALAAASISAGAQTLSLSSAALRPDGVMPDAQVFNGFGCAGGNLSPALNWTAGPEGTKSFVLTVYDPDAPTGSGWWHWVVYDIPADVRALSTNAGAAGGGGLPKGAKMARTDFGTMAYGGACPPAGSAPHHYQFTLRALKVDHLGVPPDASPALIGFMALDGTLAQTTLTVTYKR